MNRHYYISDNLDELERLEAELEASGIATEQIHVLSEKDAETGQRHLHEVSPFMKKDVVRSGRVGLLVGLVLAQHKAEQGEGEQSTWVEPLG